MIPKGCRLSGKDHATNQRDAGRSLFNLKRYAGDEPASPSTAEISLHCRAMIYAPGSPSALPESPATLEKSSKEAIVAEARKIVDARLNAQY
jgi:hypothetical protein